MPVRYLELDKYYTNNSIVKLCLSKLNIKNYDFIIEPSAGAGAFSKKIRTTKKIALDIEPEARGIRKGNYFDFRISQKYKKVLVVGNPPFGKKHSLSTEFIKYSLSFSNVKTIAFILPNVYKKHTRQKILPENWRIKKIIELGKNSFSLNGETKHIPCSFFIFDKSKGKDLRVDVSKNKETKDFTFGTKNDFDLFVFGASPKKVLIEPLPNNRGHFIKVKGDKDKNEVIKKIKTIDWKGNSCANGGVYWLTQNEFAGQYNSYFL